MGESRGFLGAGIEDRILERALVESVFHFETCCRSINSYELTMLGLP